MKNNNVFLWSRIFEKDLIYRSQKYSQYWPQDEAQRTKNGITGIFRLLCKMEKINTIRKRKEEENVSKGGYKIKYVKEIEDLQGKMSNKVCTLVY